MCGCGIVSSVKLHHPHHLPTDQDGTGENTIQAIFFRARRAAKGWICGHISMPLWLARSDDASNDIMSQLRHVQGLRGLLECCKARW